jgi:hypothetical protein
MKRRLLHATALLTTIGLFWTASAEAQGNWQPGDFGAIRFRIGILQPQANSEYWDETFSVFTGSASSFEDVVFGIDYLWMTSRQTGFVFGGSFYESSATQAYLDWVDADGREIRHTTTLNLNDLNMAYVYRFGRDGVRPYVGAGGGLLWWRLREEGSFIDFADPDLPIVYASYQADGTTWELLGLAGLEIPFSFRWRFFLEGRYRWAEADLDGDFAGFGTIDLSGVELTAGFSYNW